MAERALITPESSEIQPWERLEGEPSFWYNRYKRFQSLGPKRTVLAALEQECRSVQAPKSTQNGKLKPKKPALVPGSWKQASIRWQWVERAQAYDEDKVMQMVALMFEDIYSGPALAFHRVEMLRNMLDTVQKDFNTNNARMTPDQKIAYYARMQKILAEIRDEMSVFDAPTQLLVLKHFAHKEYADYKSPTSKEGFLQLVEKAGSMESFRKGLEREIARREEQEWIKKEFELAQIDSRTPADSDRTR